MKLVVMIPARNEEETIAQVIRRVPRRNETASVVNVLVLDDASDDKTAKIAEAEGAVVLRSKQRLGLARQFQRGLNEALSLGADLIVNIDADMEHDAQEIPRLLEPIVRGEADIVLGSRFADGTRHAKLANRIGNLLLTYLVNRLIGAQLSDAQTGFRAFSREAAARLNVLSKYTYVQDVIIQASYKRLKIVEVPISFHTRRGESRLIRSIPEYALRAGVTVVLTYLNYWPLRGFSLLALVLGLIGLAVGSRPMIHFLVTGQVSPYLSSAILSALLLILAFLMLAIALLAELTRGSRELVEDLLFREKY